LKADTMLKSASGGEGVDFATGLATMIKPIVDVQHCGRRVRVQFALETKGIATKYDIIVNDRPVKVGLFAEEVMRWLGNAMHQERAELPRTRPVEGA
jgi:hypothetical protein